MIAVNRSSANSAVTESRARTSAAPVPYTLVSATAAAAAVTVRAVMPASMVPRSPAVVSQPDTPRYTQRRLS
ncbi:MAG TPA: hypothetical protein VF933_31880 [Streptosporangiaceae bacterium]